jgi:hypothetical protein
VVSKYSLNNASDARRRFATSYLPTFRDKHNITLLPAVITKEYLDFKYLEVRKFLDI